MSAKTNFTDLPVSFLVDPENRRIACFMDIPDNVDEGPEHWKANEFTPVAMALMTRCLKHAAKHADEPMRSVFRKLLLQYGRACINIQETALGSFGPDMN